MNYVVPVECVIERIVKRRRFSSFDDVKWAMERLHNKIDYKGYLTIRDFVELTDYHNPGLPKEYRSRYGWRDIDAGKIVHVDSWKDGAEHWYISLPRPIELTNYIKNFGLSDVNEMICTHFKKGEEIKVKDHAIIDIDENQGNATKRYLTWNRKAHSIGPHAPDKIEFIAEYPTHVVIRGYFNSVNNSDKKMNIKTKHYYDESISKQVLWARRVELLEDE